MSNEHTKEICNVSDSKYKMNQQNLKKKETLKFLSDITQYHKPLIQKSSRFLHSAEFYNFQK
jgi:hypothetical protein